MDQGTLAQIFEPFFTTKRVGEGTGLGLATVHGAVKQNNGFITVDSEPGRGTTFTIYLPRHVEHAEQTQAGCAQSVTGGLETILVVEDEPTLLKIAASMLEKLGYTVLRANGPARALELAREHSSKIHLVLTDMVMPEMNGRDLVLKLLALHPHLKCLLMSGYTFDAVTQSGLLDEGFCFIQKPFSAPALAAKVREVLSGQVGKSMLSMRGSNV
jgi:CheY-like chemotaxis protein